MRMMLKAFKEEAGGAVTKGIDESTRLGSVYFGAEILVSRAGMWHKLQQMHASMAWMGVWQLPSLILRKKIPDVGFLLMVMTFTAGKNCPGTARFV